MSHKLVFYFPHEDVKFFVALSGGWSGSRRDVEEKCLGIASGLAPTNVMKTFEKGFDGILSSVGLVIGLGCMLGGPLLNSGGADRLLFGQNRNVFRPPKTRTAKEAHCGYDHDD